MYIVICSFVHIVIANSLICYRIVEWLDEYHPGSFRQAQVSFSTRIPSAFPLGDSLSMSTTVSLYNTAMCIKHLVKEVIKEKEFVSKDGGASPTLPVVKEEDENKEETEVFTYL